MSPKRIAFAAKWRSHLRAAEHVDHSRTKARSPQTRGNVEAVCRCGIVERFRQTMLHESYQAAFRKRIYTETAQWQADLDTWMASCNEQRPHQGRWCCGKTPVQTFVGSKPIARDKTLSAARHRTNTPHPTPNKPSVRSGHR